MATINLGDEGLSDGDRIDPYFDSYVQSGNEVIIPDGSYQWDGTGVENKSNMTVRAPNRAELHRGDGWNGSAGGGAIMFEANNGTVRWQNISIRGEACGNKNVAARANGGANLELVGLWLPDGSRGADRGCAARQQGIFVPSGHAGDLLVKNAWVEGWTDNGIYGSPPGTGGGAGGTVRVHGGLFRNNNISQVRLGSDGSEVVGTAIAVDGEIPTAHNGAHNGRGVYLREPGNNMRVVDCDILMAHSHGAVSILAGSDATGGGTIRNNRVQQEIGNAAIHVHDSVLGDWGGGGNHITGSGNRSAPSKLVACSGSGCTQPTIPSQPGDTPTSPPDDGGGQTPDDGTDGGGGDTGGGDDGGTSQPVVNADATTTLAVGGLLGATLRKLKESTDDN